MILYQPAGGRTCSEVEVVEQVATGDIVLSVGGLPILYLNRTTCSVHLLPNDTENDHGLAFDPESKCVLVKRDVVKKKHPRKIRKAGG